MRHKSPVQEVYKPVLSNRRLLGPEADLFVRPPYKGSSSIMILGGPGTDSQGVWNGASKYVF